MASEFTVLASEKLRLNEPYARSTRRYLSSLTLLSNLRSPRMVKMLFSTRMSRSFGSTSGRSAFTTSSCSVSKISTAGAQLVRLDSSPVRSNTSLNTRLSWSCKVEAPRKGSKRLKVLMIDVPSYSDFTNIIKYERYIVKLDLVLPGDYCKSLNNNIVISDMSPVS